MAGIRPQSKNANRHTQRGMALLEKSIGEDGWIGAVTVAADGETFDGSARVEKIAENGMLNDAIVVRTDGSKPIVVVREDIPSADDPRAKRLGVAANRVAELNLEWEPDVLAELAGELDLSGLFTDVELADLAMPSLPEAGAGGDEFDATPEDGPTRAQLGDLWILGLHRLLCGDSTKREHVQFLMGGEIADTLVSDPPYGVGYEYDEHDDSSNADNLALVMSAFELGPRARVWTPGLMNLARDLAWNVGAKTLCWHKKFAAAGNGLGGASTWEPVIVIGVKGGTLPNDYLEFMTDRIPGLRDDHPCPKPIGLYEHLIQHLAGQIIYEPFCGSGTTLIAAQRTKRRCFAIELSPRYCDVILRRWEAETGQEARLERRISD